MWYRWFRALLSDTPFLCIASASVLLSYFTLHFKDQLVNPLLPEAFLDPTWANSPFVDLWQLVHACHGKITLSSPLDHEILKDRGYSWFIFIFIEPGIMPDKEEGGRKRGRKEGRKGKSEGRREGGIQWSLFKRWKIKLDIKLESIWEGVNACFPLLRNQFTEHHKEWNMGLCGESIRSTTRLEEKVSGCAQEAKL